MAQQSGDAPPWLARWRSLLEEAPASVVAERDRLIARADALAATLDHVPLPAELDVVVSGAGFMAAYYLGVHAVIARRVAIGRYAGASTGAQAPFQQLVHGEAGTLDTYLTFGFLVDHGFDPPLTPDGISPPDGVSPPGGVSSTRRPSRPAGLLRSAYESDRHWRALAQYLATSRTASLKNLTGRCYVSGAQKSPSSATSHRRMVHLLSEALADSSCRFHNLESQPRITPSPPSHMM